MTIKFIQLRARFGKRLIDAQLTDQITGQHQDEVGTFGQRSDRWRSMPACWQPIDLDWKWAHRFNLAWMPHGQVAAGAKVELWALECAQAASQGLPLTQGFIVLQPAASALDARRMTLHVNLLGVAPHNRRLGRPPLSWPGRYLDVKRHLLLHAVERATQLGFGGVLSGWAEQGTETFHQRMGWALHEARDACGRRYLEGRPRV